MPLAKKKSSKSKSKRKPNPDLLGIQTLLTRAIEEIKTGYELLDDADPRDEDDVEGGKAFLEKLQRGVKKLDELIWSLS